MTNSDKTVNLYYILCFYNEKEARYSTPMGLSRALERANEWVSKQNEKLIREESWRGDHGWRATWVRLEETD